MERALSPAAISPQSFARCDSSLLSLHTKFAKYGVTALDHAPLAGPSDACHGPALPRPRTLGANLSELLRCYDGPPPTFSGSGAGNQPPATSPADIPKSPTPGLALAPATPRQVQP
eukprot:scaffold77736_cov66-Phaeocystis_antarctica.AAC.1